MNLTLPFSQVFFGIALGFDAVALVFAIFAGFEILYHFLSSPKKKGNHTLADDTYHEFRRTFIHRIILAIDFFLVADLMKLAFVDTLPGLIQILFIVVIRTILSYFLLKEADMR